MARGLWAAWVVLGILGLTFSGADAAAWQARLDRLIGPADSALVADPNGKIIYARHADRKRIPASTLKPLTALSAYHWLGPDHRFKTEFYTNDAHQLKIKGYGDPLLISEVMPGIAAGLKPRIARFSDLVLDSDYFSDVTLPGITGSLNPYDAPNGALCVNFNTVSFKQDQAGGYVSAEPQTPLLPVVIPRIRDTGLSSGRILLPAENQEITWYAGHLFAYFLKRAGMEMTGKIRMGAVDPRTDRLLMTHVSPFSLDEAITGLMAHSNNFIANQLFIASGIAAFGPPGDLDKGIRAVQAFCRNRLKLGDIVMVEGSGLSRENRISAADLLTALSAFTPRMNLLKEKGRCRFKTGSLTGVKSRAGFLASAHGGHYRFVVMINTPEKSIDPILALLESALP